MRTRKTTATLQLTDKLELVLSGDFTPSDAGVMYHKDGSGTPPEGAEFDIQEIQVVKGTNVDLVEYVGEFYAKQRNNLRQVPCVEDYKKCPTRIKDGNECYIMCNKSFKYNTEIFDYLSEKASEKIEDEMPAEPEPDFEKSRDNEF